MKMELAHAQLTLGSLSAAQPPEAAQVCAHAIGEWAAYPRRWASQRPGALPPDLGLVPQTKSQAERTNPLLTGHLSGDREGRSSLMLLDSGPSTLPGLIPSAAAPLSSEQASTVILNRASPQHNPTTHVHPVISRPQISFVTLTLQTQSRWQRQCVPQEIPYHLLKIEEAQGQGSRLSQPGVTKIDRYQRCPSTTSPEISLCRSITSCDGPTRTFQGIACEGTNSGYLRRVCWNSDLSRNQICLGRFDFLPHLVWDLHVAQLICDIHTTFFDPKKMVSSGEFPL